MDSLNGVGIGVLLTDIWSVNVTLLLREGKYIFK